MKLKLDCLPSHHTCYDRAYHLNAKFNNGTDATYMFLTKEIKDSSIRYYVSSKNNMEQLVSEEFFYDVIKDCKDYYEEDILKYYYEGETVTISVSKYGIIADFRDSLQVDFFE